MTVSLRKIVLWGIAGFVLIQFIPVTRDNPPVQQAVPAPENVRAILERSCYDCHSNQTVWPWYSHVAPISWVVASDVHGGRRHANFTTWNAMSLRQQHHAIDGAWDEVSHGDMPLWYYLPMHPKARLSDDDKAILHAWTESMKSQLPPLPPGVTAGDDEH